MSLTFSPSRKRSGFATIALSAIVMLVVTMLLALSSVSAFASEETPPLESPIAEVEPLTEPDPDPIVESGPEVDPPTETESKKVFVCKYVGTPGVDERLQTGDNPISVSVNAIENNGWDGVIPGYFSDAQGRSLVIAYDSGQDPEPTCPGGDVTEVTPPAPVWTDPCGPDNGFWTYTDTEAYTYLDEGLREDGLSVITAEANEGYVFPEDAPFQWSETDSGELCPPEDVEVTPPAPVWTDPCGPDNGYWTYVNSTGYSYSEETVGDATVVTASANRGFFFPKDATTQWSETDSGELCPPEDVEVTPEEPVWTDPCGPDNGFWTYTDTEAYTYLDEGLREDGLSVITAEANEGYVFPEDAPFQWSETDSGELCPPVPPILAHTGANTSAFSLAWAALSLIVAGIALVVNRFVRRKVMA